MTVTRAYARVDGRQLHYRHAGDPAAPALVLLHQSPSTSAMYEQLMARLAARFYLLAPDTPGFGGSDPLPLAQVSIADYAAAVKGWLDSLAIGHCCLFGHHTGAGIAVQLEHDYPGTARAMALSGPPLLSAEQREALPEMASPFPPKADGGHLLQMWQRIGQKDPQAPLDLLQREVLSALASGEAYQASYTAVTRQDFAGQLPALACPVLVFAGDADPLYHAVEPTLGLLQQGSTLALPGGERTYVCERQAEWVATAIGNFFEENVSGS